MSRLTVRGDEVLWRWAEGGTDTPRSATAPSTHTRWAFFRATEFPEHWLYIVTVRTKTRGIRRAFQAVFPLFARGMPDFREGPLLWVWLPPAGVVDVYTDADLERIHEQMVARLDHGERPWEQAGEVQS